MSPRQAALLDPDLEAGLKRLKLAAVRTDGRRGAADGQAPALAT